MVALLILAIITGIGTLAKMIAWCIDTWREGDEEDKLARFEENSKLMSFEEFSEKMKNKETFKLGK